jgi:VanZ family protein
VLHSPAGPVATGRPSFLFPRRHAHNARVISRIQTGMADRSNRSARWLFAVVVFLIVYGSLFPFNFGGFDVTDPRELLARLEFVRTTRADIAINLLLYVPFGACLTWALTARLGGALAALTAMAAGAGLSLVIEMLQLFETRRVASLGDVLLNTGGSLVGALLAATLLASRNRPGLPGLGALARSPAPAALVLLWLGARLLPFAPTLDPDKWRHALIPLNRIFEPSWASLRWAVPYFIIAEALRTTAQRGSGTLSLAVVALIVFVGQVLIVGRAIVPAEVAGMLAALVLAWICGFLARRQVALLASLAIAVLLITDGLIPFAPRLEPWHFGWVPFEGSLRRLFGAGLVALFQDCFFYGALVWLLCRSGMRIIGASLLATAFVFSVEVLQGFLPGRAGDITDPLITLALGTLIALFEPDSGTTADAARGSAWSASRGRR